MIIACIVHAVAVKQASICHLFRVAHILREFRARKDDKDGSGWEAIEDVIKDGREAYLILVSWTTANRYKYSTAIYEADMSVKSRDGFLKIIGSRATEFLDKQGSSTMVIRLETYLRRLK